MHLNIMYSSSQSLLIIIYLCLRISDTFNCWKLTPWSIICKYSSQLLIKMLYTYLGLSGMFTFQLFYYFQYGLRWVLVPRALQVRLPDYISKLLAIDRYLMSMISFVLGGNLDYYCFWSFIDIHSVLSWWLTILIFDYKVCVLSFLYALIR